MIHFKRPIAHYADPSLPQKLRMQSLLSCSSLRAKISSIAKSIQVFEAQKNPKSQQQMNTKRQSYHATSDVMAHPMDCNQDLCPGPSTISITFQKLIQLRLQAIQISRLSTNTPSRLHSTEATCATNCFNDVSRKWMHGKNH